MHKFDKIYHEYATMLFMMSKGKNNFNSKKLMRFKVLNRKNANILFSNDGR